VTVLRPTLTLKLLTLAIAGLAMAYLFGAIGPDMWGDGGELRGFRAAEWMKIAIAAMVAYALLNIFLYEARYDTHSIFAPDWFLRTREYLWKDLISIRDNGHYLYVLRFEDGRTLELQKYLVGIREFLSYATDRIEANCRL
jgi:hypothetical protein